MQKKYFLNGPFSAIGFASHIKEENTAMSPPTLLTPAPLTAAAFAPFGQIIEAGEEGIPDSGYRRFDDLAQPEVDDAGRLALSLFLVGARPPPVRLACLERHPYGSQAFVPLDGQMFLVIVCASSPESVDAPAREGLRIFISNGRQGINMRRGVWHHPLLALTSGRFLIADRLGPGDNCALVDVQDWAITVGPASLS